MTHVVVERLMVGAIPDRVWKIASDLLSYPRFMEQVISVESRALEGGGQGTSWTVLFNGNELQWIEEDVFYPEQGRMTFQQTEGDLAEWRGSFHANPHPQGVLARYEVEFDLGIPALSHVLHPLGEAGIRSNCEQMLLEIEAQSVADVVADAAV